MGKQVQSAHNVLVHCPSDWLLVTIIVFVVLACWSAMLLVFLDSLPHVLVGCREASPRVVYREPGRGLLLRKEAIYLVV